MKTRAAIFFCFVFLTFGICGYIYASPKSNHVELSQCSISLVAIDVQEENENSFVTKAQFFSSHRNKFESVFAETKISAEMPQFAAPVAKVSKHIIYRVLRN